MKYLIIILFLLSSCETKRAANKTEWLKKHGYLTEKIDSFYSTDTIQGFDSTILRQFDSTSKVDTMYIQNEGVTVKTVIKWKQKIVSQQVVKDKLIRKTLHTRKVVTITKTVKNHWFDKFWIGFISALLLVLALALLLRYILFSLGKNPSPNTH